jgi:precorrin-6B methylase 2
MDRDNSEGAGSETGAPIAGFGGAGRGTNLSNCFLSGLIALAALSSLETPLAAAPETNKPAAQLTIPYVPTRHDIVRDMLWLAEVGKDDVVYDLGSGDGRVVIAAVRDFGARRAVGIDIDPQRIRESWDNARQAGVTNRVEFIQGDLFTNDFSQATVVTLFLGGRPNLELRRKLISTLKPGTRVVSHMYGMGEWAPEKSLRVKTTHLGMYGRGYNRFASNPNVPEFDPDDEDRRVIDTISMCVVPAPIAGVWRGRVPMPGEDRELKLALHQSLSQVMGSFELLGSTNLSGWLENDLWGKHLRFQGWTSGSHQSFHMMFDGHADEDAVKGTLAVFQNGQLREYPWAGKRDHQADFAGTWEWSGPTGERPVQLKIERRDGKWIGTYTDRGWNTDHSYERETSVSDFYDFGGGFYFTYLIGRLIGQGGGGYSLLPDDNAGWLIGEAITEQGGIAGTISFYPCNDKPRTNITVQNGPKPWSPKRVAP